MWVLFISQTPGHTLLSRLFSPVPRPSDPLTPSFPESLNPGPRGCLNALSIAQARLREQSQAKEGAASQARQEERGRKGYVDLGGRHRQAEARKWREKTEMGRMCELGRLQMQGKVRG